MFYTLTSGLFDRDRKHSMILLAGHVCYNGIILALGEVIGSMIFILDSPGWISGNGSVAASALRAEAAERSRDDGDAFSSDINSAREFSSLCASQGTSNPSIYMHPTEQRSEPWEIAYDLTLRR